ncbi:MAG: C40 family peptidase [Thermoleophilia bacterium]|nr:C40 family peptidase [Thermoleophilia bacterium]
MLKQSYDPAANSRAMVRIVPTVMLVLVAAMLLPAAANAAAARTVTTTAKQRVTAANIAVKKLRSPYRSGAAGPGRFDCSGLVTWAFRQAGKPLEGRSSFDLWKTGVQIGRMALRRGDLVWTWDRRHGHVGIYLGGGRYVHAPGQGRGVEVAPLPSGRNFVGAIRP